MSLRSDYRLIVEELRRLPPAAAASAIQRLVEEAGANCLSLCQIAYDSNDLTPEPNALAWKIARKVAHGGARQWADDIRLIRSRPE